MVLVDPSGSGKSTLIRLALRLQDPTLGSICIDGTDIRSVTLYSLRQAIVPVFQDAFVVNGTIARNIFYGKMPFLEGRSLETLIRLAPLQRFRMSDALRVGIHIGSALQHAHENGVTHLDVKPGNVIVTPNGLPVLFDFGAARGLGETRPDTVIGNGRFHFTGRMQLGSDGSSKRCVRPRRDGLQHADRRPAVWTWNSQKPVSAIYGRSRPGSPLAAVTAEGARRSDFVLSQSKRSRAPRT